MFDIYIKYNEEVNCAKCKFDRTTAAFVNSLLQRQQLHSNYITPITFEVSISSPGPWHQREQAPPPRYSSSNGRRRSKRMFPSGTFPCLICRNISNRPTAAGCGGLTCNPSDVGQADGGGEGEGVKHVGQRWTTEPRWGTREGRRPELLSFRGDSPSVSAAWLRRGIDVCWGGRTEAICMAISIPLRRGPRRVAAPTSRRNLRRR